MRIPPGGDPGSLAWPPAGLLIQDTSTIRRGVRGMTPVQSESNSVTDRIFMSDSRKRAMS